MTLHLDYRPKDFDEVIGNNTTIKSLQSILARKNKDFPHAWMFEGPSGTGKTTLARILAKHLGCPTDSMDFQELDIAQLTGIDTAREIRSAMKFMPVESDVRIYLLDEIHKGSNSFQNGLLKALEDTPKHVHFILCTTEPKKVIVTVRNRCTSFKTENQSMDNICRLLEEVLDAEGVDDFDTETIEALAQASLGSPRDALKRLDQVLDLDPDERMEVIENVVDQKQIIDLCRALIKKESWSKVAGILKDIKDDPEQVRQAVNGYMSAVLLNNKSIDAQALYILVCFDEPNFYNGKPGLVQACANIYN